MRYDICNKDVLVKILFPFPGIIWYEIMNAFAMQSYSGAYRTTPVSEYAPNLHSSHQS
jgi:hypothetical protein